MKILLSSRTLFLFGFFVIVVANIVVLCGVASNRSGQPESEVILTERELHLPYEIHEENSGLALRLTWRTLGMAEDYNGYSGWGTPAWLNSEKLEELGFDINDFLGPVDDITFYKQPMPKEVFIVLENDGKAYGEAVRRAEVAFHKEESFLKSNPDDKRLRDNYERAEKRLKREHMEETRLFAIDAGLDPGELRDKYGDQSRFIITKGVVEARYDHDKNRKKTSGYISRLSVASIHVPLKHRQVFDSILVLNKSKKNDFRSPRFEVTLAYGSRFEPWIVSVRSMDDKSD